MPQGRGRAYAQNVDNRLERDPMAPESLLPCTVAGSLPKPSWLAGPEKLRGAVTTLLRDELRRG